MALAAAREQATVWKGPIPPDRSVDLAADDALPPGVYETDIIVSDHVADHLVVSLPSIVAGGEVLRLDDVTLAYGDVRHGACVQ